MTYAYVGRYPDTLGDGRPVAPGDRVQLNQGAEKHPHNKRLIDEGTLLAVPTKRAAAQKEGDDQ